MNIKFFKILMGIGALSSGLITYYIEFYSVIPLSIFLLTYYLINLTNDNDYTHDAIKIYNLASKSSIGLKILPPIQSLNPKDFEFQFLERDKNESKYLLWFNQSQSGWYDTFVFEIPKEYNIDIIKTYIPHNIERRSIGVLKNNIMKIYFANGISRTIMELNKYSKDSNVKSMLNNIIIKKNDKYE